MAEENKKVLKKEVEKAKAGVVSEAKDAHRKEEVFDPWKVLTYPHMAEKSMALVDTQNKIVFIVNREAGKDQIRQAFEKLFEVKVASVKTEITLAGQKKAFIKLQSAYSAADIATKLGIL